MHYMLGTGLQGKTLGIVGLGQIGTATARRARAFGMEIVYSGRRRADEAARGASSAPRFIGFDELLATERRRLAALPADARDAPPDHGRAAARRCARDAYLVNTTRGPVVDEARAGRGAARRRHRRRRARRVRARARGASRPARARERRAHPAPRLGDDRDAHGDGRAGGAQRRCGAAAAKSR